MQVCYAFLKGFKVGDNFFSKVRQFHIVVPLYEKGFWPFADSCIGILHQICVFA